MPDKVIIEVSGGVATCTSKPNGVEVEIIDHDDEITEEEEELEKNCKCCRHYRICYFSTESGWCPKDTCTQCGGD